MGICAILTRNMHILTTLKRFPLLRNIAGAFVGAAAAMTIYGAYGIGARVVASVFPPAEMRDTSAEDEARSEKLLRVAAHAKALAEARDRAEAVQVH